MDTFKSEGLRNAGMVPERPLDEAKWEAWLAKGRAQDRRDSVARLQVLTWATVTVLLAAAGFWPHAGTVEIGIRFLVMVGAVAVMAQAFQAGHYAVSALFAAVALFYNPVMPAFHSTGDWQRAAVVASAILFGASLAWPARTIARTKLHA